MAAFVADTLHKRGIEPSIAYYQPYSLSPILSVPHHRLAARRIGMLYGEFRGYPTRGIGAWLPELEFTHYWPTKSWRELIDRFDVHLSVSGNCLAATPYALSAIPFWSWVATDWLEDRVQRAEGYPWYRKPLDRLITVVGARHLEKKILTCGGTIVALSEHTKRMLGDLVSRPTTIEVMPMGIDTDKFSSTGNRNSKVPVIGFVGRLDDPRKNIELLLHALARCREKAVNISAILVGEGEQKTLKQQVEEYRLGDTVTVVDYVENSRLPQFLSQMDVFVVPSHQEGLCIAALEAMACGVPLISTRCGGPEEFVIDGETGYLVDADPASLAQAITRVISESGLRNHLGKNARNLIEMRYSTTYVQKMFWSSFCQTFSQYADWSKFRQAVQNA